MDPGWITGPLIGAVIGYITNYLAVKMLFRPRREIRIFGKRMPFTPGVIPKGKDRLAAKIGKTVAWSLMTEDELGRALLSEEMKGSVMKKADSILSKRIEDSICAVTGIDAASYDEKRSGVCAAVSGSIYESVTAMPIREKAADAIADGMKEKLAGMRMEGMMGSMIASLVPQEKIDQIAYQIADRIAEHVERYGMEYIGPAVYGKADEIGSMTGYELLAASQTEKEKCLKLIGDAYERFMRENLGSMLARIDIAGLVEDRVKAMDVEELEEMTLSVMKKELNTIVRLGALLGFLIGILNIFI